ncbi:MAG: hypothetical protein IKO73_09385 [Bacteroidaceae bacterium]|nr:hypothetical protein [Bacteroidaceae bacterium]
MERFNLEWQGQKFPAIATEIHTGRICGDMMEVTVASTDLWNQIREDVENCRNADAIRLDENIFGYLSPEEMAKTDEEVQELIQGFYE